MGKSFHIGLVQHDASTEAAENLERAIKGVRDAAARGAQVVCLQELFLTRYFCVEEDAERFDLAEPEDGPTVAIFQSLAKELAVVIVVPFFERRASGIYHNSAAVIDADGSVLGTYRKMHIPDDPLFYEKFYFTPGDADGEFGGFRVFQTKYARVGVLICWDQWYPEAARLTALHGADVLFYPTAIGWLPEEKDGNGVAQREAWQTMQRSHAIANGVYVAAANRIGFEPAPSGSGIEFWGSSFVSDPFGQLIAEAPTDVDTVLVAECSPAKAEAVRRDWPFFRDRRIDAYQSITARSLEKPKGNQS